MYHIHKMVKKDHLMMETSNCIKNLPPTCVLFSVISVQVSRYIYIYVDICTGISRSGHWE